MYNHLLLCAAGIDIAILEAENLRRQRGRRQAGWQDGREYTVVAISRPEPGKLGPPVLHPWQNAHFSTARAALISGRIVNSTSQARAPIKQINDRDITLLLARNRILHKQARNGGGMGRTPCVKCKFLPINRTVDRHPSPLYSTPHAAEHVCSQTMRAVSTHNDFPA